QHIYTLKKPFLIQYCENKNLKSTGTTIELRARLSRYLRGAITLEDVDDPLDVEKHAELSDSSPDQKDSNKNPSATYSTSLTLYDNLNNSLDSFSNRYNRANSNLNTNSILPKPIALSKRRMNEKTLMIKPDNFTGTENVRKFFKQYIKISDINEWNEHDKLKFFSIFVKGTASTFLENLEDQKGNGSWKELEVIFLNEFQPIEHDTILQIKLEKPRQGENESTTSFLAEIESLCRQVNKHISEKDICGYILKGLKDNILQSISMRDNNSLKNLKENLIKFELMQFRIKNKKDDMSEYTEILNEQVLQLNLKTKDIEIENNELRRQIKDSFSRDRENKININKL
ncbi:serine/threonine-protein kinase fray2-like, partial [Aphis craccivora]